MPPTFGRLQGTALAPIERSGHLGKGFGPGLTTLGKPVRAMRQGRQGREGLVMGKRRNSIGMRLSHRLVAVAGLVLALAVAHPAAADSEILEPDSTWEQDPMGPAGSSHDETTPGVAFVGSFASTVLSVVTFPIRIVVGTAGAFVGGIAGGLTGGDQRTAAGVWNVTTDGSYFVTQRNLERSEPFRLSGDHP
jgi:hypothetical protein